MKQILIFAGTTEGRELSERLAASGIAHTVCVATEYGELVLTPHPLVQVHRGRMDEQQIRAFVQEQEYAAVVDATHPYAQVVTENIRNAMQDLSIPYLRLARKTGAESAYETVTFFPDNDSCAAALKEISGNILLTTGSKELSVYAKEEDVRKRLYVRILPGKESIEACAREQISGRQVIAMQGPFSAQMNLALLMEYQIQCLVTKASGQNGGYLEKLQAAQKMDIPVYVIGHATETGKSFAEVCRELETICGTTILAREKLSITLAGVGMGNHGVLTEEVRQTITEADILLGASRMIAAYEPHVEKKPYYAATEIIPYLREVQGDEKYHRATKIAILFSGDSGFYSGAQALYQALQEEIASGRLQASLQVMPGVSSVAYLAACLGESYQDADICSMHGKTLLNLAKRVQHAAKIYVLMSGVKDLHKLGEELLAAGLTDCRIYAGYQMSYPEQKILCLTPEECTKQEADGLYTCMIQNPHATPKMLTHGISDEAFLRGRVPMTKEEVRQISICKLQLYERAVVYDIGSGTGSIAMEIASLSPEVLVYAIERKAEALDLLRQNKAQMHLENVHIIEAEAPGGLRELPKATHAFIGGSGGHLAEILDALYDINPRMCVVINAISMETLVEIREAAERYRNGQMELVQVQVSRAHEVGAYHLMQAQNPVWICRLHFEANGRME